MSWNDYYARRAVLDTVLKLAGRNPGGPLPFAEVDRAEELFGTPKQLLQALYYRWNQILLGHLRSTVGGPEDAADAPPRDESDNPELVAAAWRKTADEHPTLRAVLDAHADELQPELKREQRLLAITAGLAELHEPRDEVTRVGASFMALLRHGRPATKRRAGHSVASGLLRLLSPAS